jgi:hypothetical protein
MMLLGDMNAVAIAACSTMSAHILSLVTWTCPLHLMPTVPSRRRQSYSATWTQLSNYWRLVFRPKMVGIRLSSSSRVSHVMFKTGE